MTDSGSTAKYPPMQPPADAVAAELALVSARPRWDTLGPAVPLDPESPDKSRFAVEDGDSDVSQMHIQAARLVPRGSGSSGSTPATLVSATPTRVVVEVSSASLPDPPPALVLEVRKDSAFLLRSLHEYLLGLESPVPLVDDLLAARCTPGVPRPAGEALNVTQAQAVADSTALGVNVIWGPPGTGKTHVIAHAIAELLEQGRSVLLLSNTNVAVDHALLKVHDGLPPAAGPLCVRLGLPSSTRVAHEKLTVEAACSRLGANLAEELADLRAELAELSEEPSLVELNKITAQLGAITEDRLVLAIQRCENTDLLVDAQVRRAQLAASGEQLEERRIALDAAATETGLLLAQVSPFARRWQQSAMLELHLEELAAATSAAASESTAASAEVARIDEQIAAASALGFRDRRKSLKPLKAARLVAAATRSAKEVRLNELRIQHAQLAADTAERLALIRPSAADPSAVQCTQAAEAAVAAEAALNALDLELANLRRDLATADRSVAATQALEQATDADRELCRCAGTYRSFIARRNELAASAAATLERITAAMSRIVDLEKSLAELAPQVLRSADLVATTLSKAVTEEAVRSRGFDHVIVDEVSAALLPYVVAAAAMARRGVTLLGDHFQNGPISRHAEAKNPARSDPHLAWLSETVFDRYGLSSPRAAAMRPGVTVLTEQFRFGQVTTDLVNRITYDGVLQCRRPHGAVPQQADLGEVTFIDTDLAGTSVGQHFADGRWKRNNYWSLSATVARALAEHHAPFADVGIITPYRLQKAEIEAAMAVSARRSSVEVGTSHAFQGREFPVVIFDMVEDGEGKSWPAAGRRQGDRYQFNGMRLSNVAFTRNTGTLYIVGSASAVRTARPGSVLAGVKELVQSGDVSVLPLRSLAPGEQDGIVGAGEAAGQRLELTLSSGMTLLTESTFEAHFFDKLAAATSTVRIFSPFLGSRLDRVLPRLVEARDRGVEVTVICKPGGEKRNRFDQRTHPSNERWLKRLEAAGIRWVGWPGMHQKVIVIDDRWIYGGSLNALSYTPATAELMWVQENALFAKRNLEFLRDELKTQPK